MLFADQGAEVIILNKTGEQPRLTDGGDEAEKRTNDMLNRNKIKPKQFSSEVSILPCFSEQIIVCNHDVPNNCSDSIQDESALLKGADVIIVDGERQVDRAPHQV